MSRHFADRADPEKKKGTRRVRPLLLVLLWVWAGCVFVVVDLFRNVEEFDAVRPRSQLYHGMQRAAHELVDTPFDERELPRDGTESGFGEFQEKRRLRRPIPLKRDWYWVDHGTQAQRRDPIGRAEGELRDGKREGRWTWTRYDGTLREERHYRDGRLHGRTACDYENGRPESEEHYEKGEPDGPWKQWYPGGGRALEESYRRGVLHGTAHRWHPNGELAGEARFQDGVPVGTATFWHANGRKALEGEFRDGKRWGRWRRWDTAGAIVEEPEYLDGKKMN
jgi:antitoxin component YwqK of YwqJK toxin-antitoxin module